MDYDFLFCALLVLHSYLTSSVFGSVFVPGKAFEDELKLLMDEKYSIRDAAGPVITADEIEKCKSAQLIAFKVQSVTKYKVLQKLRWRAANECCRLRGKVMVTETTNKNLPAYKNKVDDGDQSTDSHSEDAAWTSANNIINYRLYEWQSGEDVAPGIWGPGEPNNKNEQGGLEGCGHLFYDMHINRVSMNDYSCFNENYFICEDETQVMWEGADVKDDELRICRDLEKDFRNYGVRYYHQEKVAVRWKLADKCCKLHGLQLISLDNEDDEDYKVLAANIHASGSGRFLTWTSGNDLEETYHYKWQTGESIFKTGNFSAEKKYCFFQNYPQMYHPNRHCIQIRFFNDVTSTGEMEEGLRYRNVQCGLLRDFICERPKSQPSLPKTAEPKLEPSGNRTSDTTSMKPLFVTSTGNAGLNQQNDSKSGVFQQTNINSMFDVNISQIPIDSNISRTEQEGSSVSKLDTTSNGTFSNSPAKMKSIESNMNETETITEKRTISKSTSTTTEKPATSKVTTTTTAKPVTTEVTTTTAEKPTTPKVITTTTAKPVTTEVTTTTTEKPATPKVTTTTTAKPATSKVTTTTTAKPAISEVTTTTTEKLTTSEVTTTATEKPATSEATAMTTERPAISKTTTSTTERSRTSKTITLTTEKSTIVKSNSTTNQKPAVSKVKSTTKEKSLAIRANSTSKKPTVLKANSMTTKKSSGFEEDSTTTEIASKFETNSDPIITESGAETSSTENKDAGDYINAPGGATPTGFKHVINSTEAENPSDFKSKSKLSKNPDDFKTNSKVNGSLSDFKSKPTGRETATNFRSNSASIESTAGIKNASAMAKNPADFKDNSPSNKNQAGGMPTDFKMGSNINERPTISNQTFKPSAMTSDKATFQQQSMSSGTFKGDMRPFSSKGSSFKENMRPSERDSFKVNMSPSDRDSFKGNMAPSDRDSFKVDKSPSDRDSFKVNMNPSARDSFKEKTGTFERDSFKGSDRMANEPASFQTESFRLNRYSMRMDSNRQSFMNSQSSKREYFGGSGRSLSIQKQHKIPSVPSTETTTTASVAITPSTTSSMIEPTVEQVNGVRIRRSLPTGTDNIGTDKINTEKPKTVDPAKSTTKVWWLQKNGRPKHLANNQTLPESNTGKLLTTTTKATTTATTTTSTTTTTITSTPTTTATTTTTKPTTAQITTTTTTTVKATTIPTPSTTTTSTPTSTTTKATTTRAQTMAPITKATAAVTIPTTPTTRRPSNLSENSGANKMIDNSSQNDADAGSFKDKFNEPNGRSVPKPDSTRVVFTDGKSESLKMNSDSFAKIITTMVPKTSTPSLPAAEVKTPESQTSRGRGITRPPVEITTVKTEVEHNNPRILITESNIDTMQEGLVGASESRRSKKNRKKNRRKNGKKGTTTVRPVPLGTSDEFEPNGFSQKGKPNDEDSEEASQGGGGQAQSESEPGGLLNLPGISALNFG